jgi:hypothetical protein
VKGRSIISVGHRPVGSSPVVDVIFDLCGGGEKQKSLPQKISEQGWLAFLKYICYYTRTRVTY